MTDFFDIVCATLVVCAIFDGARRVRWYGFIGPQRWLLLAAMAVCVAASVAFYAFSAWGLDDSFAAPVPMRSTDPSLSPNAREAAGRFLARAAFVHSGRLVKYVDSLGVAQTFTPTQEDLDFHETILRTRATIDAMRQSAWLRARFFAISGVVALILGVAWPRVKP